MEELRQKFLSQGMDEISFFIVNSKSLLSQLSIGKLTSLVSFPVYQERYEHRIWESLLGKKDDIIVYDRCGRLVDHHQLPYSYLGYDYVEQTIVRAYYEEPCGTCEVFSTEDWPQEGVVVEVDVTLSAEERARNDTMTYLIELEYEVAELEKKAKGELKNGEVDEFENELADDEDDEVGWGLEKLDMEEWGNNNRTSKGNDTQSRPDDEVEIKNHTSSSEEVDRSRSSEENASNRPSSEEEESKAENKSKFRFFLSRERKKGSGSKSVSKENLSTSGEGKTEKDVDDKNWWKVDRWPDQVDKNRYDAVKDDKDVETRKDDDDDKDWWKVDRWPGQEDDVSQEESSEEDEEQEEEKEDTPNRTKDSENTEPDENDNRSKNQSTQEVDDDERLIREHFDQGHNIPTDR